MSEQVADGVEGHARLRCQVSAAHEKQHLDAFGAALRQLRKEFK